MRRTSAGLAGVVAVVVLGLAGPAAAVERPNQDSPFTVWVQPGTAPLDGLGTFVYVAQPGAPGPTQGSPAGGVYTLNFRLEDGSFGVVAMGHQHGVKVLGFGIIDHTLVTAVPYDWKYGPDLLPVDPPPERHPVGCLGLRLDGDEVGPHRRADRAGDGGPDAA